MKIRLWALPAFFLVMVLCLGDAGPAFGAQLQILNGSSFPGYEGDPGGGLIGYEGISSGGGVLFPLPDNSTPQERGISLPISPCVILPLEIGIIDDLDKTQCRTFVHHLLMVGGAK